MAGVGAGDPARPGALRRRHALKRYGVAIQGAGWVSDEHIRAYINNPHTFVAAIGSRTQEGARAKAQKWGLSCPVYDDLEDMLADPQVDIVSVCTPNDRHPHDTILAAQAGKHILIEKPPAIDLEGLRAMRDAVRRAGVKTLVGFVLRWNPLLRIIGNLTQDGTLGRIVLAQLDYWHHITREEGLPMYHWLVTREKAGSIFLAGGSHAVDAARWLIGDEVVEVQAYATSPRGDYTYAPTTVALLRFAGGTIAKVSACVEAYMPYVFNIDLLGENGSIRGNRLYARKLPGQTGWATIPTIQPDSGDVSRHQFQQEIDHFVECVINDVESPLNLEDGAKTTQVCLAADLSAAEGRPVRLPLL